MTWLLKHQAFIVFSAGAIKVYSGYTGHSIETKVKEHHHCIWLYHLHKLAMAENSSNMGHHILAKKLRCMDRTIRETREVKQGEMEECPLLKLFNQEY
jgi:hypothetical protein